MAMVKAGSSLVTGLGEFALLTGIIDPEWDHECLNMAYLQVDH